MPYATFTGTTSPFYEVDPAVAEVVNFAIHLGRPLLVEGEPGCGKTTLAKAIAHELGLGDPIGMTVKSSFQARDLLYRFNALKRLQDTQDPSKREVAQYVYPYVSLEPLGLAIHRSRPCVVLIDEIDKADIDFPNDLLEVLGAFAFDIDEMPADEDLPSKQARNFGRRIQGDTSGDRPIVVITSNREKQLPEPFLRRCLYIELKFPEDPAVLEKIIRKNLGGEARDIAETLVGGAIRRFLDVRRQAQTAGVQKPPATSELIDWIRVLHWKGATGAAVDGKEVPYWKVLFKTMQDIETFGRQQK